jgi:hypothetical protein
VALALAATSYAGPAKAKEKAHAVVGTLQKVDGQTLTVQTAKGAETVMLVSNSRIHRGAESIQPAGLSTYAGERVKIRYVDHNGQKEAESITLATSGKTPKR